MTAQSASERMKVLIVDDHPAVREALRACIAKHSDLSVCGEAGSMIDALGVFGSQRPDVVIVDISLRESSGLELIKRLRAQDKQVRILVWSMHNEKLYAERSLQAGAHGYVTKDMTSQEVVSAIRQVLHGKVYLSAEMSEQLLLRAFKSGVNYPMASPVEKLSDRELEVFQLIGQGLKTQEIGHQLHLSAKTIETYRDRIREKLGFDDSSELQRYSWQWMMEQKI